SIGSSDGINTISCRSKPLNPVGHRINASTKMGLSFLLTEGWLEFGPSVEDVDPPAIGWSGDDGGRQKSRSACWMREYCFVACVTFSPVSAVMGVIHCAACPGSGTSPLLPRMFGPAFSGSDSFG